MKEKDVLFLYDEIGGGMEIPVIREELMPYLSQRRQGEFTIDDYNALPEEQRVELIDGVIYDMAAPSTFHQFASGEIRSCLNGYILEKDGECIVIQDIDTRLEKNDKTILRPDISVVCDRKKLNKKGIFGAPDLVIEVLSPSTRWIDIHKKREKYLAAGVREYWMVDPERKQIVVYELENTNCPVIYPLEGKIPVGIFNGECVIDFAKICGRIGFLDKE